MYKMLMVFNRLTVISNLSKYLSVLLSGISFLWLDTSSFLHRVAVVDDSSSAATNVCPDTWTVAVQWLQILCLCCRKIMWIILSFSWWTWCAFPNLCHQLWLVLVNCARLSWSVVSKAKVESGVGNKKLEFTSYRNPSWNMSESGECINSVSIYLFICRNASSGARYHCILCLGLWLVQHWVKYSLVLNKVYFQIMQGECYNKVNLETQSLCQGLACTHTKELVYLANEWEFRRFYFVRDWSPVILVSGLLLLRVTVSFGSEKSEILDEKEKTRYEGKFSASQSKGFLLLGQCLKKKEEEAVVFAGNNPRESRRGHNPLQ